jgi:hypothetical protein
MTNLSLIFLGLGRLNRQVRQELLNEKNPKLQITNHKSQIPNSKFQITNSQTNFRETVSCLPFLVSISLLSLFTNDQ